MPVARKYGPQQQALAPLPGAFLSPEGGATATSEGAGVEQAKANKGAAIAELGTGVARLGIELYARQQEQRRRELDEARQRAIKLNVIEGENALAAWERNRVYDPEQGALTRRGKAALGLPEEIDAEFEKVSGDVAKTMATPEAKLAFEGVRANRRDNVGMAVRRHVDREIQTYTLNEVKARIENGVDAAINAAMQTDASGALDFRAAASEMRRTEEAFVSQAQGLGWGTDDIKQQVDDIHTKVHVGIINQLLAQGSTDAARKYFNDPDVKNDIDPEVRDDVQKAVQAGVTKKTAQIETEKILAAGGTLEEQRAKAKMIDDADVQDEVLSRLEHESALKERKTRDDYRALTMTVANQIDRTKSVANIPQWEQLEPSDRSAFRSYAKALVEKGDVDTDLRVYYSELQKATADPLAWAQSTNLTRMINRLGKTEFKQLADLQADIISGNRKKAEATINGYLSSSQVVANSFGKAGLDTSPKPGTPEATQYYAILGAIDERVRALKANLPAGKEPSTQDIQAIADEMLIDITLQRGSFVGMFTSAPYNDVKKRIGEITIADMPANLKKQAEDSLRRNGRVVSDAEVLNLYRRMLLDQQKQGTPAPSQRQVAPQGEPRRGAF